MISISKDHNPNYLAKIIEIKGIRKHENADKLQVVTVDFQNVITGMDAKDGDIYVFFPLECQINSEFLSKTNSFREAELNSEKEKTGFFEKNCRVRAVKLRGEKSMGYLVPVAEVEKFSGEALSSHIGQEFDTLGDYLMLKKYEVITRGSGQKNYQGKKPRISRIIDGQVHLHVDTENLRKNAFMIKPDDEISISYKFHGTSFWISNVLGKRKLNIIEKILSLLGVSIQKTEYDHFFGSRKVVKNQYETQHVEDFYDGDLWGEIKDRLKDFVPKCVSVYGECVGHTKSGAEIQSGYDYGCVDGNNKLYIYRVTITTPDGIVMDLGTKDCQNYCMQMGLTFVPVFYTGKAKDLYPELDTENHWHEEFIKLLEKNYTDKDCYLCKNKVPEEGIVLRKENSDKFESYKLKSFLFLLKESEELDKGLVNIEDSL